jgi:hypothetical protein
MRVLAVCLLLCSSVCLADEKLGKPLNLTAATPITDLAAKPAEYVGKTVQVKGKVTEVCQNMGCWMVLADPSSKATVRIKVKDGEIVFPKSSVGKTAVAEGKFVEIKLNKEQALERMEHEAKENGKPFDPATVKSGITIYQIQGTGALIE